MAHPPRLRPVSVLAVMASLAAPVPALAADSGPAAAQPAPKLVTLQGIRSATVAPGGIGFVGLSFSSKRGGTKGYIDDVDGSAILGLGLGDAAKGIGVQLSANITSLKSDFGDSGHLSVKLARRFTSEVPTFVALSLDRLGGWGDARKTDPSVSAMVTTFPTVEISGTSYPVMLTLGAGSHVRNFGADPGLFFGMGIGLTPNFGASLAYTGDTVSLGGALRINGLNNVALSATLDDVFDQKDSRRVGVSATLLFNNLFGG